MVCARIVTLAVALSFIAAMVAPTLAGPPAGRGHGGPPSGRGADPVVKGDTKGDKDKGDAAQDKDAAKEKKDVKGDTAVETKKDDKKKDDKAGDAKQAAKPKGGDDKGGKGAAHSNKGGKLRGLDRADEVAGEHGKQGRDNARAKQER